MAALPADSADAVVTDPPYGINYLGLAYDAFGSGRSFRTFTTRWATEALRVLRPGCYLAAFSAARTYHHLATGIEEAGFEIRDQVMWIYGQGMPKSHGALKPAHDPIVVARKPGPARELRVESVPVQGAGQPERRPANVVLDEYAAGWMDSQSGLLVSGSRRPGVRAGIGYGGTPTGDGGPAIDGSQGGASRFFYRAKVRVGRSGHPNEKPLAVVRWLIALTAESGSLVLDPFAGSGTTGIAAWQSGCGFLGFEIDPEVARAASERIRRARGGDGQATLFD